MASPLRLHFVHSLHRQREYSIPLHAITLITIVNLLRHSGICCLCPLGVRSRAQGMESVYTACA